MKIRALGAEGTDRFYGIKYHLPFLQGDLLLEVRE